MIERYTRPVIGAVWTDEARMEAWRKVEVAACEEMDGPTPQDLEAIRGATFTVEAVKERGIHHEVRVMSAHRDPERVADYARNAKLRGLRVIIAGAGLSAALPGVVAAHTDLPVIGVPLSSSLSAAGGLDALLSVVQMPPGVPVASVGLDNPRNAAHLAVRIINA